MSCTINKIFYTGIACIATGYVMGALAEQSAPPKGNQYKSGACYDKGDMKKIVIGYSGHHKNMKFDPLRPLYFGSKYTAQGYAELYGNEGVVFVVVAEQALRYEDYGTPRTATNLFPYGHFAPISPKGIEARKVALVEPEAVTLETKVGKIAAIHRLWRNLTKK